MTCFCMNYLVDILLELRNRGVRARVLINYVEARRKYSRVRRLVLAGVAVRWNPSRTMHHKSVVIDGELFWPVRTTGRCARASETRISSSHCKTTTSLDRLRSSPVACFGSRSKCSYATSRRLKFHSSLNLKTTIGSWTSRRCLLVSTSRCQCACECKWHAVKVFVPQKYAVSRGQARALVTQEAQLSSSLVQRQWERSLYLSGWCREE